MICPDCGGTGKVHLNKGFNERTGKCEGKWANLFTCYRCDGLGDVLDEMAEWIAFGKYFREKRRLAGETIGDAAKRLRMTVPLLSAIENGRKPMPTQNSES